MRRKVLLCVCLVAISVSLRAEGWEWWDRSYPVRGEIVFDGFVYTRTDFIARVEVPEEYKDMRDVYVVEYSQNGQMVGEAIRGRISASGYISFLVPGVTKPFQKRYFAVYLRKGEGIPGTGCVQDVPEVKNGGFEEWEVGMPVGWKVYGRDGEFKPAKGYDGGLALELESKKGAFGVESDFMPVEGGKYYLLKVRIAHIEAPEKVVAGATAEVVFYDGQKRFLGYDNTIPGDRSVGVHPWYLLLYGGKAPEEARYCKIRLLAWYGAKALFDDVELVEVDRDKISPPVVEVIKWERLGG